jgi:hypothetical protein
MDESGVVWQLVFCFPKKRCFWKVVLKGPSVEPWAMVDGKSSSYFWKRKNQWETAEIPGWFSPRDFVLILKKTSCSFGRGCALKNTKCFTKQPCIKYCYSAKYPELHIVHALYLIPPFRGWRWAAEYVSTHPCLFVVFREGDRWSGKSYVCSQPCLWLLGPTLMICPESWTNSYSCSPPL